MNTRFLILFFDPYLMGFGILVLSSRVGLSVKIFGKNRPKSEFPSQEAIDTLCLGLEFYQFENEERLHNWLKEFKEYEDFMTPEEYMEK